MQIIWKIFLQNMIYLGYGQSKTEWACGRELEVIFIDFGGATPPVLSKVEFTLWFTIQRSHGKFPNWSPFEVANPPFSMYHPPQSPESPQEMPRFEVKFQALGCVILPKVLKNIGTRYFPIPLALRTSPSENFSFFIFVYYPAKLVKVLIYK